MGCVFAPPTGGAHKIYPRPIFGLHARFLLCVLFLILCSFPLRAAFPAGSARLSSPFVSRRPLNFSPPLSFIPYRRPLSLPLVLNASPQRASAITPVLCTFTYRNLLHNKLSAAPFGDERQQMSSGITRKTRRDCKSLPPRGRISAPPRSYRVIAGCARGEVMIASVCFDVLRALDD
jgi:hypothetical protein